MIFVFMFTNSANWKYILLSQLGLLYASKLEATL